MLARKPGCLIQGLTLKCLRRFSSKKMNISSRVLK